jgi:hypothetical protein
VNVLLGAGIARIPEVMQELHRQKFSSLVAVEYEKKGDVNQDGYGAGNYLCEKTRITAAH